MFTFRTKLAILKALAYKKKTPYYIQYYINSRCNLRCKQCNIVESNSGIRELSLDEIEIVAKNIAEIGGGIVLLTGGEPFLRKDLPEIVAIFKKNHLDVRLQTAGIASSEQIQRCYDNGGRDLNISLDSLSSDKQDYINSVPGSWESAISAIHRTSQIFKEGSAICSLGCVLSKFNYKEVPAILEFATKIGWHLSLVPVHITQQDQPMGFRSYEESFVFSDTDIKPLEDIIEKLLAMKKQGFLLFDSERFLRSSLEFIKTGRPTWRHHGVCDSPNLYFAVRPNGDFTTCCDYTLENTHNLADHNFPKAYLSGEIDKLAAPIVKSCNGCHYGSYPEVTISVRDKKALFERVLLTLNSKKTHIQDLSLEQYHKIIDDLKSKYAHAYSSTDDVIEKWSKKENRKELISIDNLKRKSQGRIRKRMPRDSSA